MKLAFCSLLFACAWTASAVDVGSLVRTGLVLPDTVLQHQSEIGISSEQADHLRKLYADAQQEGKGLEAAVKEQQQAFDAAVKNPETTPAAASEQLKQLLEAEAALKQLQLRTLLKLRDELSPEQRTRALKLGTEDAITSDPIEARLREKGMKLKAAFEAIGVPPPEALKTKGEALEALVKEGRLSEAEKALDALIKETGLDEIAATPTAVDFGKYEPGTTDLPALQDRYTAVRTKAGKVIYLPTLRLLAQGRDELEKAKTAEDATRVARILTWAEGILDKQP